MAKVKTSVLFKQYNQQQHFLLPPTFDELIEPKHLVRVVNTVVDSMDIGGLINLYEGGGTTSYHPRMLLKILLYGYSVKIYTGRKIARALRQDINFMWLSGMNRPNFRTINNFRSSKAKEVIEELFREMLEFLMEQRYIKMENYFCDGSTFRADGNQHKMVWKKNAERYKEATAQKCQELFKQIDELNATEDKEYGKSDLEEHGGATAITPEIMAAQTEKLNETLKNTTDKKLKRKAESLRKKMSEAETKLKKYETQINKSGRRSGYNKTDEDASAMMMKNKVEILPAYNVLAGSEDQFITGVSVHQNTNDATCFSDHLDQVAAQQPLQPDNIIADSIFGTEQNYELLEQKQIGNYLKFPLFHKEQKQSYKNDPFLKDNFRYNDSGDTFACPNNQLLVLQRSYKQTHQRTGYQSLIKEYECSSCADCPFYDQCCKSEKGKNRTIKVNEKLEGYKKQARENLHSEQGIQLRKRRSIEIESCFGDIKHNMGFRRFHLRSIKKVKTEFTLIAMAHNLRKMHLQLQNQAS